jgi:DNA-binding MarR family transcriptional regulator
MRKVYTMGQSEARDVERTMVRDAVYSELYYSISHTRDTLAIADEMFLTHQAVVSALTQLVKQGRVERLRRCIYRAIVVQEAGRAAG